MIYRDLPKYTHFLSRMGESEGAYSAWTASALIFNLIVGMGVWTMPKIIFESGTLAAYVILLFSGFLSYIVATYINELQGSSNAISKMTISQVRNIDPFVIFTRPEITRVGADKSACMMQLASRLV